ncbi:ATP-grasp domain-containing protein [Blastococcus saxobsidens]|nr:ATP-grasp domain-containing protein [Blastococcus saxobsidens]
MTEHQGKQLLGRHGVPVPAGVLWSESHGATQRFPVVVKTQIQEGGRGRRGGVEFAHSDSQVRSLVERYRSGTELLPPSRDVLVEEALDIARELYLAVLVDRDVRGPVLLAGRAGGIDVESQESEHFLRIPLEIDVAIPEGIHQEIARHLGVAHAVEAQLRSAVVGLWRAFLGGDCLLAEVNPLVVTDNGRLVAADARVVVDDAARVRHPDWPPAEGQDPFEASVEAAGAVGTLLDGNVAVVTSGAGLGMATVDLVTSQGGRPACLVDLGGTVFRGPDVLTAVLAAVGRVQPDIVFVNVFLQAGPCDDLARALRRAGPELFPADLVLRLRGNRAPEARGILAGFPAFVTEDLAGALREVARLVRA